MKVGNGNNTPVRDDLIGRMKDAHRTEAADPVDISGGQGADAPASGAARRGTGSPDLEALQEALLDTAKSALNDQFDSVEELRAAVVEVIVEERYSDQLPPAQAEQVAKTLQATLADDPVFRGEVDNMLLHAARRLGQQQADSAG